MSTIPTNVGMPYPSDSPGNKYLSNQIGTLYDTVETNRLSHEIDEVGESVRAEGRHAVDSLERFGLDHLNALRDNNDNLTNSFNATNAGIANVATSLAGGNFTTLQSINGALAALTAQNNQSALAALNTANIQNMATQQGFNSLTAVATQGFNTAAREADQATAQIIAQGVANASAMAECCCEIKQAISAGTAEIANLITSNRIQDLQSQLAVAQQTIASNAQTSAILAAIAKLPTT